MYMRIHTEDFRKERNERWKGFLLWNNCHLRQRRAFQGGLQSTSQCVQGPSVSFLTPRYVHRWACSSHCGSWWSGEWSSLHSSCSAARSLLSQSRSASTVRGPSSHLGSMSQNPLQRDTRNGLQKCLMALTLKTQFSSIHSFPIFPEEFEDKVLHYSICFLWSAISTGSKTPRDRVFGFCTSKYIAYQGNLTIQWFFQGSEYSCCSAALRS